MDLTQAESVARHQAFKEVLSAIRYGDLKGPIGDEMRKPPHLRKVGGMLLVFEEWFCERFADELKTGSEKGSL